MDASPRIMDRVPALVLLFVLTFGACSARRQPGGDDDVPGPDAGGDAGDPCPESLCCVGKACPAGFLCDTDRNTCVGDPCMGAECCDDRPCGDGFECLEGECVRLSTVGNPCTSDDECSGPEAQCLLEQQGWPGGYCLQDCAAGACPPDAVCVSTTCFDGCQVPGDCRAGYDCIEVLGGSRGCRPQ